MIHAAELRIGNLIILDWDGSRSIQQIDGINLYDGNEPRVWFREWDDFALSCIDSIPLTPEILHKCGFASSFTSDPQEPDASQVYEINLLFLHQHIEKENRFFWYNGDVEMEVKYLHQLQNLYFALTGTELNYQP